MPSVRVCEPLPEAESIAPGYEQKLFAPEEKSGRLRLVASRDGREGSLKIHQDVSVYNALLKVPEIVELHPLFGEYDLIAKIEGSDFDTLGHIIVNKIRTIEGVMDTKTLTGTRF